MIFYFSGCGNSRAVARAVASALNEQLVFIMDAIKADAYDVNLAEGEALGFIWPTYCWAPPRIVLEFVAKLKVQAPGKPYVYFVTTYGDSCGRAENVFRKALKGIGLELDAAFGVCMPETYVNFDGMDLDTPEKTQLKYDNAKADIPAIVEDVRARRNVSRLVIGPVPFLTTYAVRPLFYRFLVTDRKWKVTDDCIHCGICAKVCPFENITFDGTPHWNGNCTTCNACYHACPKHAIQFGKVTLKKGQYKSPDPEIFC